MPEGHNNVLRIAKKDEIKEIKDGFKKVKLYFKNPHSNALHDAKREIDALAANLTADAERIMMHERLVNCIKNYIVNPIPKHFDDAVEVAKSIDNVLGGYIERTNFRENIENLLKGLFCQDIKVKKAKWMGLLRIARYTADYFLLKKIFQLEFLRK